VSKQALYNQISNSQRLIGEHNTSIIRLQQEIAELQAFKANRIQVRDGYHDEMNKRRTTISRIRGYSDRLKSGRQHSEHMDEMLNNNASRAAIDALDEIVENTQREIDKRENEIGSLNAAINSLNSTIASCQGQIRAIDAAEAAAVAKNRGRK
jgi:peptidoglycan hydrolase CwlO-like protein